MKKLQLIAVLLALLLSPSLAWAQVVIPGTGGTTTAPPVPGITT